MLSGNQRRHGVVDATANGKALLTPREDPGRHSRLDSPSTTRELPDIHFRDQSPNSDVSDGRSNPAASQHMQVTRVQPDARLSPAAGRHQWIPGLGKADCSSQSTVSSGRRSAASSRYPLPGSQDKPTPTSPRLERKVMRVAGRPEEVRLVTSPQPQTVPPNVNMSFPAERSRRLLNVADTPRRASPSRLSPSRPIRRGSFEAAVSPDVTGLSVSGDHAAEARFSARPILRRSSCDHSPIKLAGTSTLEEKLLNMKHIAVNGSQMKEASTASVSSRDARQPLPAISPPLITRKSSDS